MGHRRCRGATAPWAAVGGVAVVLAATGRGAAGRLSLRATWPPRGPPRGRAGSDRPVRRLTACRPRLQRTAGQLPDGGAAAPSGPEARRAVDRPASAQPGSTHPGDRTDINTSPRDFSRAGTPLPHAGALHMPRTHVRPDLSGLNALTVFTSCDEMATPRNRRGEPSGAPLRRACIPAFHSQTRCCRREFTRPRRRGHAPPHARDRRLGHTAVPLCFRPDRAGSARAPPGRPVLGTATVSRRTRRTRGTEEARGHPRARAPRSTAECQFGAAPAHSGPTARHRSPASAHAATRRTTVSWWSDRKKCPPGSVSSRKPAVV